MLASSDQFRPLINVALRQTGAAAALLWVPDKRIDVTQSRGTQTLGLTAARQQILAWMQAKQQTLVVNSTAGPEGAQGAAYKVLACPVRYPASQVIGLFALFSPPGAKDFDPLQRRMLEHLTKKVVSIIQLHYDSSTGLMTRQAFEQAATPLLQKADGSRTHCVLYADIDRLHVINETMGMQVGDEAIVSVAECLRSSLPAGSLSARISGDRLAALIPDSSLEEASTIAETVRARIAGIQPRTAAVSFEISASIGVAPVSRADDGLTHALATAEAACKAAKDRGRNRVERFEDTDRSIIGRHTDIHVIGRLHEALGANQFRLDAQPIVPLRPGQSPPRYELLIRMLGENNESIPPGFFLSAADRYQLMPSIDRWVVSQACTLLGEHVPSLGAQFARFAINLSGQSLRDESFLQFILQQIHAAQVPARLLCFELTETSAVGKLADTQNFIRTLQELGCQFALDDFGTGISSLAFLKDLPVNYLKIDGSFVRDALRNSRSESMVRAISQMAKTMGMETIAEYVESEALRERMASLGVDYGQGFALGKTQPLRDLLAAFETSRAAPEAAAAAAPGRAR